MSENSVEGKKPKILVLIPALNEERNIASVIQDVRKEITEATILVINDGSVDATASKARQAGAKVLSHPFNMGYGVALQTGYKYALKYGFDCVVQMDGDGQHDPRYIDLLIQELDTGKADIVIGSRFLVKGKHTIPLIRRIGMGFFGFIAGLLCGQTITDPTSGYQALSRRAVEC